LRSIIKEKKNSSIKILSTTTKNIGGMTLIKPLLDSIGIGKIVDEYCPMERDVDGITNGQAIEALVLNRLTSPTPLVHVEEWARQYALQEICGISPDDVNDDRLGRALDAINPNIEFIEADLAITMMTRYKIKPELIHFDSTSLYFEGEYEESDLLRLGYSRDKKAGTKQVNLTLDVDSKEGMPLFHTTHNGNKVDPHMAIENMEKIKERLHPEKLIMVGDRGEIDGDVALKIHTDYGLDFIAAVKMSEKTKELVLSIPDSAFKSISISGTESGQYLAYDAGNAIKYSASRNQPKRELDARGIVVLSRRKVKQDKERRDNAISEIFQELNEIKRKLNKRHYKNKDFVSKKIASIFEEKERYAKHAHLFRINLKTAKKTLKVKTKKNGSREETVEVLSLSYSIDKKKLESDSKLDGKYLLSTTLLDWNADRIVESYRTRYVIESRIRNMKSEIKVRPVFLHDSNRIISLVFMSVLALMVYSLLEILARRSGIMTVWGRNKNPVTTRQLMFVFETINLVELLLKDGSKVTTVQDLAPVQETVLKKLEFAAPQSYID
jgi:transposase